MQGAIAAAAASGSDGRPIDSAFPLVDVDQLSRAVLDRSCHVMSDPRFAPSLSGKRVGGMASGRDTGGEEHGKLASASP